MHSKVVFECIRLRSIFVRKRIQHDVAQRQHQHLPQDGPIEDTDSSPPIEVVPTSSAAFWGIKEDEEMPGFPSEKSTGIPHVRQWLKEITLGQREEHLDAILNEYSSLLHPFYQWSQVSEEDVKGAFTKQDVEECLSPVHDRFTQVSTFYFGSALETNTCVLQRPWLSISMTLPKSSSSSIHSAAKRISLRSP